MPRMRVTVSVTGEGVHEVEVDDAASGDDGEGDAATTYADLIAAVGLSPQEATALVDGRPVPEDAAIDAERVEVLRLVKGG